MTNIMECDIDQPTKSIHPAPLVLKRRVGAGEVEQRFARGRSKAVAIEVRRKTSPIRAWRAAESDPTPEQQDRAMASVATAALRQPLGPDAGAGARLSALERAARMRAIEQAWKEERARQAELEAEGQRRAEASTRQQQEEARRQADELKRQAEAQRAAEERARLTIEQVRRFRAKAQAEVGVEKRQDAAGRGNGRGHAKRATRAPVRRDDRTSRRERRLRS